MTDYIAVPRLTLKMSSQEFLQGRELSTLSQEEWEKLKKLGRELRHQRLIGQRDELERWLQSLQCNQAKGCCSLARAPHMVRLHPG